MFDLNIRLQLAAIFIFVLLFIDYIRKKKLPLLSTKHFSLLLFFSGVNLVFDVLTVYSLVNYETFPKWANRLFHQIFIGSLDFLIFFLFLYVDALCKREKRIRFNEISIIKVIPFALSMIMVIFGPLYYEYQTSIYSYGLMADTIYASVAIYMVLSIIELIVYRKNIEIESLVSIITGITLWAVVAIIQKINPAYLLSGIALVGMLVILYFSLENPMEHTDIDADAFDRNAFLQMMNEAIYSKKDFLLFDIVFEDFYSINRIYSYEKGSMLLASTSRFLKEYGCKNVFHIRGNMLSIVCYDIEKINEIVEKTCDFLDHKIPLTKKKMEIVKKKIYRSKSINRLRIRNVIIDEIPAIAHIDIIKSKDIVDYSISRIINITDFMAEKKYGGESDTKVVCFSEELFKEEARKQKILEILNDAFLNDGFEMVYQPIYNIKKNKFITAEALVRLKDNVTLGYISPEEFITIAEKYGLINKLSEVIFNKVCEFIKREKLKELGIDYVEVNLSAIQCIDADLPELIKRILKENGLSPKMINLEITETALVTSNEMLTVNMKELRRIGCSFSMDDFGTGYSNLSKIAEVKYEIIKLDKSLIWPCFTDKHNKNSLSILNNITKMLYDLNVNTVAEGVETLAQYEYLKEHNVTYIQGYYFSKPLSEMGFVEFIKREANR